MINLVGWDIGGANIKAAYLELEDGRLRRLQVDSQPFEIWRDKDRLPQALRSTLQSVAPHQPVSAHAVTMTAELSDVFATKRAGVQFVFESMQTAFPGSKLYGLNLAGQFEELVQAQTHPLDFAAANWLATALWMARSFPDCLLIDVGSTTTDIIPLLDGKLQASGRSDLERLASGELVYTGILRTNLAAVVQSVPLRGRLCRVASEYFSITGDIHLILGHISDAEYTCPTPDGRPVSIASAHARLARLVCADSEMLTVAETGALAAFIYLQQLHQVESGLAQVLSRLPRLHSLPVLTLGSGAFLAAEAARRLGLHPQALPSDWDQSSLAVAPCVAAGLLLAAFLEGSL